MVHELSLRITVDGLRWDPSSWTWGFLCWQSDFRERSGFAIGSFHRTRWTSDSDTLFRFGWGRQIDSDSRIPWLGARDSATHCAGTEGEFPESETAFARRPVLVHALPGETKGDRFRHQSALQMSMNNVDWCKVATVCCTKSGGYLNSLGTMVFWLIANHMGIHLGNNGMVGEFIAFSISQRRSWVQNQFTCPSGQNIWVSFKWKSHLHQACNLRFRFFQMPHVMRYVIICYTHTWPWTKTEGRFPLRNLTQSENNTIFSCGHCTIRDENLSCFCLAGPQKHGTAVLPRQWVGVSEP